METHYQTPTLVDAVLSVGVCQVEAVHEWAFRSRGFRLIHISNNRVRLSPSPINGGHTIEAPLKYRMPLLIKLC